MVGLKVDAFYHVSLFRTRMEWVNDFRLVLVPHSHGVDAPTRYMGHQFVLRVSPSSPSVLDILSSKEFVSPLLGVYISCASVRASELQHLRS